MPTPVACLLKRPVMKFILLFNGAIGSRLLPNSMSTPAPFAHQCFELMPLPMNNAAKRLGNGPGVPSFADSAPQTGIDSSQGRAIATPTPRRKRRREVRRWSDFIELELRLQFIASYFRYDLAASGIGGWLQLFPPTR